MTHREQLIDALAHLDPATLEDVINTAYRRRVEPAVDDVDAILGDRPTAERFARWLARRHLNSDAAVDRVIYLPSGAPEDEIRLLEVNRFLNPSDLDAIEPLDFTPDTGPSFRVLVADITSDQWERVQVRPEAMLPPGWGLEGLAIIERR